MAMHIIVPRGFRVMSAVYNERTGRWTGTDRIPSFTMTRGKSNLGWFGSKMHIVTIGTAAQSVTEVSRKINLDSTRFLHV